MANGFIFTSGVDGVIDESGHHNSDVTSQTQTALGRIEQIIRDAGATLDCIVQLDQYLAESADREPYMRARDDWLHERAPAVAAQQRYASLLVYPQLATADMRVELRAVACVPSIPVKDKTP